MCEMCTFHSCMNLHISNVSKLGIRFITKLGLSLGRPKILQMLSNIVCLVKMSFIPPWQFLFFSDHRSEAFQLVGVT